MPTKDFLKPKLTGGRFEGHAIPLEFLKDLAVLEEMLIEVAKWKYRQEHQDRRRSPRGFTDGIELKLTGVEEGSAIPVIALVLSAGLSQLFPGDGERYLEKARDAIVKVISDAENNRSLEDFPDEALGFFDRMGRSLREGEALEFDRGTEPPARLTRDTRRKLILASSQVNELTEETFVRGFIPSVDQKALVFSALLFDGRRISGPIAPQHREIILDAFNGYAMKTKVLIQGVGKFNRQGRLESFETLEHVSILDPLDVGSRLEELRELNEGWMDGRGAPLSPRLLEWLTFSFEGFFPNDLPFPFIYPTIEGGVQAEWAIGDYDTTLEINLFNKKGEWHSINIKTGQEEVFQEVDLSQRSGWEWIGEQLRAQGTSV